MGEEPPKKRRRGGTRRKTGCYTCKARHARCDEKKPICSNCERLNLDCKQPDPFAPSEWTTVFEVSTPSSTINNEAPPPSDVSASQPSSTWDVFRPRIRGLDQTRDGSSPNDILSSLNFITPTSIDTTSTVETVSITSETAFLLQTYVRSVAQWMDLMDHRNTYQLKIPRLTLTSPLLFHCLCAFTAKHLALSNLSHNPSWDSTASDHYGRALQLLIHALNTPSHEHALTATILLSSYEIVARLGSEYHRRHFLGLTMLVKSLGVNAQSTGIDRANFWIYVRHEIGLSLATERPLVLDPLEWNVAWEEGETAEDVLGNRVLWILARVCNLVFSPEGGTAASKQKRQDFLLELQEWKASLSDIFIGIPYGDEDEEGFRKVYFTVTAAAAAAFWYHITHILLYAEPTLQDPGHIPLIQDQAMRLTNIALSDFTDALKVFSTHGLYYAAKHISGISRKARIWNILNEVETQTGYHTRSVVKRLQALVEDQGRQSRHE